MAVADGGLAQATLAILTWKSPKTLAATLESLAPIATAFGERLVLCQEGDAREIALAEQYGYRAEVTADNLGILGGLEQAVLRAKFGAVLLLENDAAFLGSAEDLLALEQIALALQSGEARFACLMDRRNGPRGRFFKYWQKTWPPRPTLRGKLRRQEARAILADSLAFAETSTCVFAEKITDDLWRTSSAHFPWSNRAKFVTKAFFIDELVAFARANPTPRTVNGLLDLEHQINAPSQRGWYRAQNFPLLVHGKGLFGHRRYDRPDGDEKWETGLAIEPPE